MTNFAYLKEKVYYAQNREDLILEAFFIGQKKGFYVDVGAYDPDYDSVTKRFYERGWSGINLEPQPERHALFVKKRPRDTNLNIGISDKNTTLNLRSYINQGLSTFSDDMKNRYGASVSQGTEKYVDVRVAVETLSSVFEKYNVQDIDFIKIDVEGLEYEVIRGNDWTKYRPSILCVEADHIIKDWRPVLRSNNYELVFNDGLNDYYRDKNSKNNLDFKYIEYVILKQGGGLKYEDYVLLEDEVKKRDLHIKKLLSEIQRRQDYIDNHKVFIAEQYEKVKSIENILNEKIQEQNNLRWIAIRFAQLAKGRLTSRINRHKI